MRNFRLFRAAVLALVCLGFTGTHVGWADPADDLVPTAPKASWGSTARVGTVVGSIYGAPTEVLALGLNAAIGQRFGRLGFEAEYTYLGFDEYGPHMTAFGTTEGNISIGNGHRVGVLARLDVVQLGPVVDRQRALVTIYVEGGAGIAWNHWTKPAGGDPSRLVPDDTKRTEGQAGFGVMIFPHRVAWLLGWRFAVAPHEEMTASICRGVSCRPVAMPDSGGYVDRSMLFQSSLEFTF